jgi:hypothetical protein
LLRLPYSFSLVKISSKKISTLAHPSNHKASQRTAAAFICQIRIQKLRHLWAAFSQQTQRQPTFEDMWTRQKNGQILCTCKNFQISKKNQKLAIAKFLQKFYVCNAFIF